MLHPGHLRVCRVCCHGWHLHLGHPWHLHRVGSYRGRLHFHSAHLVVSRISLHCAGAVTHLSCLGGGGVWVGAPLPRHPPRLRRRGSRTLLCRAAGPCRV